MPNYLNVAPNSYQAGGAEHISNTYANPVHFPGHEVDHFDATNIDAPSSLPSRRKSSHARRRDPDHIPRPRNAFIIFRSAYINSARGSGEGQQNELSKRAGKLWNTLSEAEKKPFHELALIDKKQHQANFPGYVYSPGTKASAKSASPQKVGGAIRSPEKKRTSVKATEGNESRIMDASSVPISNPSFVATYPPTPTANQSSEPLPAPSNRLSPFSDQFHYPANAASGIPELDMTSMNGQQKLTGIEHEPPAPFHPHLDLATGHYAYEHHSYDFMATSMPALPQMYSPREDVFDTMPAPIPSLSLGVYSNGQVPSWLLCDNSYPPGTDYLASLPNYTFTSDGRINDVDDSLLHRYTYTLTKQFERTGNDFASNSRFDTNYRNQDAIMDRFFDFSTGA